MLYNENSQKVRKKAVRDIKDIILFPSRVIGISKLLKKPTYYPEMKRKSGKEMWKDNLSWLIKNHEVNKYYMSYGMDIKDYRNIDLFFPHREFCEIRNRGNQKAIRTLTGNYNYIVLLRDKYLFASYLSSVLGEQYVVQTVALVSGDKAYFPQIKKWEDQRKLLEDGKEWVYKVVDGECADGVMLVKVHGDTITTGDLEFSKEDFIKSLDGRRVIIQNVLEQHEKLKSFGTRSVNTIRLVTIKGTSGEVFVFSAFLRLGASAESFVDNRATGGLGVGINLNNGTLMKYGFPHDKFGVKHSEHPYSHVRFEGFQLPFWTETIQLVKKAHKQFYELQSIGWDVAITNRGPVLLEGNDDWEISGPQDTSGGLKQRWYELVSS